MVWWLAWALLQLGVASAVVEAQKREGPTLSGTEAVQVPPVAMATWLLATLGGAGPPIDLAGLLGDVVREGDIDRAGALVRNDDGDVSGRIGRPGRMTGLPSRIRGQRQDQESAGVSRGLAR